MHDGVEAMGVGRGKGSQTKMTRQLMYYIPNSDYTALQRELSGPSAHADVEDTDDELDDDQEDDLEDDDEDDGYASWSSGRR